MEQKERFKLIPSVYTLFIKNGKVLLSRRFQTGFEDGNYGLVAGHVDGEETMREAMAREALEETDVRIDVHDLELALTMHRWCGDHERIDLFFLVKKWRGEIKNMEPAKCDDICWCSINQLPANTISYIRAAIGCYAKGIQYNEFGWESRQWKKA